MVLKVNDAKRSDIERQNCGMVSLINERNIRKSLGTHWYFRGYRKTDKCWLKKIHRLWPMKNHIRICSARPGDHSISKDRQRLLTKPCYPNYSGGQGKKVLNSRSV